MSYDEFADWLFSTEDVTNVLLALEAVETWRLYQYKTHAHGRYPTQSQLNTTRERIAGVINTQGWVKLPYSLRGRGVPWCGYLSRYCVSEGEKCGYVVVDCIDTCNTPITFLSGEGKLTFHFKPPGVTSCEQPGHCGFILKTMPSTGRTFRTLELCTDSKDYDNTSVHFHDSIRAENMHIILEKGHGFLYPISWLGCLPSDEVCWWNEGIFDDYGSFRFTVLYMN